MIAAAPSQRLDSWLFCARLFKSRSLAARFIVSQSIRVRRGGAQHRVDKPAFELRLGDEVAYMNNDRLVVFAVAGFAQCRGPAAQARALYVDALAGGADSICRSGARGAE